MWHRKWFFWLDQLKISRAERVAIIILLGISMGLTVVFNVGNPHSPYNHRDYKEVDRFFERRLDLLREKQEKIEARYRGKTGSPSAKSSKSNTPEVDINKAGSDALQILPGIGPALAERIIAYREEQGSFSKVAELDKVKGIGKATLQKIRPMIRKIRRTN